MSNPILYRRRIIPDECVMLKDDIILSCDRERIVTSWKTLHPKKDLHHGMSCYFLQEGFKVSKFCLKDNSLLCWYCDIVDFNYHPGDNSLIVTDLLADVIIYPDGFVKVVDLDELVAALESRSISLDTLKSCLMRLDKLLNLIYSNQFDTLKAYIENH
ncbi:MAG: DUF402 domain-containing protein [Lachnospiraceae bacterium]|nr:DUF402 domain-containing protein [Lachnospiraceae bacterium]